MFRYVKVNEKTFSYYTLEPVGDLLLSRDLIIEDLRRSAIRYLDISGGMNNCLRIKWEGRRLLMVVFTVGHKSHQLKNLTMSYIINKFIVVALKITGKRDAVDAVCFGCRRNKFYEIVRM